MATPKTHGSRTMLTIIGLVITVLLVIFGAVSSASLFSGEIRQKVDSNCASISDMKPRLRDVERTQDRVITEILTEIKHIGTSQKQTHARMDKMDIRLEKLERKAR